MNNQKIIEVKDLCYKYLTSRRLDGGFSSYKEVLKGINFSVGRGEKLSIIGPNGAGKSTLMLNIAGLMDGKYRSGEIFIYGKKLNEKNIYDIREKIGFVFQDPNDAVGSSIIITSLSYTRALAISTICC